MESTGEFSLAMLGGGIPQFPRDGLGTSSVLGGVIYGFMECWSPASVMSCSPSKDTSMVTSMIILSAI